MTDVTPSPILAAIDRYAFVYQPNGFAKGEAIPAAIERWNRERRDVYFLPADPKPEAVFTSTPKKAMLAGSRMVWADIDPPASVWDKEKRVEVAPGALVTWLLETDDKVRGFSPQPSCIIRSGRGVWVIWYLAEVAEPDVIESINRWLRDEVGGDPACVNVNHVARMPGTRNSKTGQMAEIVFDAPDRVYQIADFQQVSARPTASAQEEAGAPKKIDDLNAFIQKHSLKPVVGAVIVQGHDPDNPQRWGSRSEAVWFVCCQMARAGVSEEEQLGILLDRANRISDSIYTDSSGKPVPSPERYAQRQVAKAIDEIDTGPTKITPNDGLGTGRLFRRKRHPHLIRHDELWLTYRDGGYYDELSDATVQSELVLWLETCLKFDKDKLVAVVPSVKLLNETFSMLKRVAHVPAEQHKLPTWRDDGPNPHEIVPCANGLFHMPTGDLLPHTPDFLTRNAVPCAFDATAACPTCDVIDLLDRSIAL